MKLLKKIKFIFVKPSVKSLTNAGKTHFVRGIDFAINRNNISSNVRKITKRLIQANYEAYLVGGGVRDLLIKRHPKDFDVATNATPEQVRSLFRNCRIIGRRFRLAHIYFKDEIIEVATFRAKHDQQSAVRHVSDHGMILRDNNYGDLEEDAWRRDFTVNALYYDLQNDVVIDYTGGLADIQRKQIRIIGEAEQRYREDPVRMLRALRFAAKCSFTLAPETSAPFTTLKMLINNVPPARLFEEILKLFFTGHAHASYQCLQQHDFFALLFPKTNIALIQDPKFANFLLQGLKNTDARIAEGKSINPAFLLAVLLWGSFEAEVKLQRKTQPKIFLAWQQAAQVVIEQQLKHTAIPRRLTHIIKEIWELQYRLGKRYGQRAWHAYQLPRFRAGYDFLLLRASSDPQWGELAEWWTRFQAANQAQQQAMVDQVARPAKRKKPA